LPAAATLVSRDNPRRNARSVLALAPANTRLTFAGQESQDVSNFFPQEHKLLVGTQATESSFKRLAGQYDVIHLATHGYFNKLNPLLSGVMLEPDGQEDGRMEVHEILDLKLNANLVTLSACDTGLGRFSGGEGHLGFSQALFLAGARSLVLSLWEVDDVSTALLMTRFYENLLGQGAAQPMTKAEALAEAKRWLRGLGPDEVGQLTKDLPTRGTRGRVVQRQQPGTVQAARTYEHPYYWSGFVLIGDSR